MGTFIFILIVAALIGGVIWNHRNASAAMTAVEFLVETTPEQTRAAIARSHCNGPKAALRKFVTRVKVTPAGPGSFEFGTKIGDVGSIEVRAEAGGSVVTAVTDELYVGAHPSLRAKDGFLAIGFALTHGIYKLLDITPYAIKMKRFQNGLEGRVRRELAASGALTSREQYPRLAAFNASEGTEAAS